MTFANDAKMEPIAGRRNGDGRDTDLPPSIGICSKAHGHQPTNRAWYCVGALALLECWRRESDAGLRMGSISF